jgi:glycine/D-amino acid oxidase-like deaminating enzyme
MEAAELKHLFPDINPTSRGGMVLPYLQVEPYRYTLALGQAAEKRGVTIRQGEVVGFRKSGGRVRAAVLRTGAEVGGEAFVIATGPWTGRASAALGPEIPVLVNREQCLRMELPERLPPCGLIAPDGLTIIPKVGGDVIVGHAGQADLQATFDVNLTTEQVRMRLLAGAVELLPRLGEAKLVEHRGDFEGWSPPPRRIQPLLGRFPEYENAYVAARFGTLGMMMSLGAGEIMAALILADEPGPVRFKRLLEVLAPAAGI